MEETLNEQKLKISAPKDPEIGIDTSKELFYDIIDAAQVGSLDISSIDALAQSAQTREQTYQLLDSMAQDEVISSVLSTYAGDTVQTNDKGDIIWIESDDSQVLDYTTWLLDSLNINKQLYRWAYCLVTYGDVYVRLFRQSDVKEDNLFKVSDKQRRLNEAKERRGLFDDDKETLTEDTKLRIYDANDKYIPYVQMVDNPGEMFDLQKFGKTHGYIKAPITYMQKTSDELYNYLTRYKTKQSDVEIFDAMSFVHGCIETTNQRQPETVEIYMDSVDESEEDSMTNSYSVRRGQSILYNVFRIWRELSLLEMSAMLNRLTRSSLVRILNIDTGDMPKEQVRRFIDRLKEKIEQKTALNVGTQTSQYTNPGPIENTIYVPTHGTQGNISVQSIGGDFDPKTLVDLEYFRDKLFGGLRVPKQFFGFCLRGDTKIPLLNGENISIKDLFENKDKYIGKGIIGCKQDGTLIPTKIKNIMLTKPEANFIRITLDNGKYIDVTPDHRMMLRNGEFVAANEIKIGDSLMPYYEKIENDRKFILDNKKGKYVAQYRLVGETMNPNLEKGMQIHHIDKNKNNDDFDNLIPLTVAEHYAKHFDNLHDSARKANEQRRIKGEPQGSTGYRAINNGVEQRWLKTNEDLPEGFDFGRLPFSADTREKMSISRKNVLEQHPEYKKLGGFEKGCAKESTINKMKVSRKLYFDNMTEDDKRNYSEYHRNIINSNHQKMTAARLAKLMDKHPDRVRSLKNLRCPYCDQVFQLKLNATEYADYLSLAHLYYCCPEHRKLIDGGGKLLRSFNLYKNSNSDFSNYEFNRSHNEYRQDHYFSVESLSNRVKYLENYVPEVNHQVIDIKYIEEIEPAFDIEVEDECHTFATECGIFVHNCEDGAGFNGGTSLTILSAEYGKAIKNIQSILCQVVTDIINLFLIDRGLDNYVYKFKVRMQEPVTQEELDKRANTDTRIRFVSDIMSQLSEVEDKVIKLKVYKTLISNVVNDSDVIQYIDDYIKTLEAAAAKPGETNPNAEPAGEGFSSAFGLGGEEPSAEAGGLELGAEESTSSEESAPAEEPSADLNIPMESFTDNSDKDIINEANVDYEDDDSYLPSAADLGIDLTQKYEIEKDEI